MGPFADLFREFLNSYLADTKDRSIFHVAQPFFAFRILIIPNLKFYPDNRTESKRKLLNFGHSAPEREQFEIEQIMSYIEEK